jgi:hypothetical protein
LLPVAAVIAQSVIPQQHGHQRVVGTAAGGTSRHCRAAGSAPQPCNGLIWAQHTSDFAAALVQMFTKTGRASQISLVKEITIGLTIGAALGLWWQT